jgi:hypothetical protein
MSQRSYNHLALVTNRTKSRTVSNESIPLTLCMTTEDKRTSSNAKDTSEQETRRSTAQSLTALEAIKNLSSYL